MSNWSGLRSNQSPIPFDPAMETTEARTGVNHELERWKASQDVNQEPFDISDFRSPHQDEALDLSYNAVPSYFQESRPQPGIAKSKTVPWSPDYALAREIFPDYDKSGLPIKTSISPWEPPQVKLKPSYHQNALRLSNITRYLRMIICVLSGLVSAYVVSINAEVLSLYHRSRFLERTTYTDATHKTRILLRAWPYHANVWAPYVTIGIAGFSTLIAVIAIVSRTWLWWQQRRSKSPAPSKTSPKVEILAIVISVVLGLGWVAVLVIMKTESKHVDLASSRPPAGADIWTWTCDAVGTRTDSFFGAVAGYGRNCRLLTSTFYLTVFLVLLEVVNVGCWVIARRVAKSAQGYASV